LSSDDVAGPLRVELVITAALAGGVILLAGVASFLVMRGAMTPYMATTPLLRGIVVVIAIFFLGTARAIERRIRRGPAHADREAIVRAHFSGTLVGMALREAVGLLGGMMILVSGDVAAGAALAGAAVLVMALALPKGDDLEERLRRHDGGRSGR
jgi:hypothetical protein